MSDNQNAKAQPSFRIYSVKKDGEKAIWLEIGAAWPHKDGKGLNMNFTGQLAEGAQMVLRVPTKKPVAA